MLRACDVLGNDDAKGVYLAALGAYQVHLHVRHAIDTKMNNTPPSAFENA